MSESEWRKVIEECSASGISIKSWCEQHDIKYNYYLYWARKIKSHSQQWAQLKAPSVTNSEIKIRCGKWTIAVEDGVSFELLADVIKVVNSVCY